MLNNIFKSNGYSPYPTSIYVGGHVSRYPGCNHYSQTEFIVPLTKMENTYGNNFSLPLNGRFGVSYDEVVRYIKNK